jgi:hypothetical protein
MNVSWQLVGLLALGIAVGLSLSLRPREVAADSVGCHFAPMAGVVGDSATRLSWQQSSAGMVYTWDDAARYCATLDLHGMGWRLPSVKELQTVIDETRAMPAVDVVSFPETASDYYWTSSQVARFANEAWAVSFAYGYDGFFDVHTLQHVRCVR